MSKSSDFVLYQYPSKNIGWIRCAQVLRHFEESGLMNRVFSRKDTLVRKWLKEPDTYPDAHKDKVVFLWGSVANNMVAVLVWKNKPITLIRKIIHWLGGGDRVVLVWVPLDYGWHSDMWCNSYRSLLKFQ